MAQFEERIADWLPLDEAERRVLESVVLAEKESIAIDNALGRVLAKDISAPSTLPPLDNSAMDGYAIRSIDLKQVTETDPVVFDVVDVIHAGTFFEGEVRENQAVRIMTGAAVPAGADTVVRVEHTDAEKNESGKIAIFSDRDRGRNVRPAGEDWEKGTIVLKAGQSIGPGQITVLAATRATSIQVFKKPTVAVLASGNELESLSSSSLDPGKIPESNSHLISSSVKTAGGIAYNLGIAKDEINDIKSHIASGQSADILVTIGGASMGEGDLFKECLDQAGFNLDFWRTRIRPGSPVSFGHLPRDNHKDQIVFGLPGNPSSAMVTFEILVRPFILAMAGCTHIHRPIITAVSATDLSSPEHLTEFPRVQLEKRDGRLVFFPAGSQGSGLVRSLGSADALAIIPQGMSRVSEGSTLDLLLLHDSPGFNNWSKKS